MVSYLHLVLELKLSVTVSGLEYLRSASGQESVVTVDVKRND